jgi:hypothetical protein
LGSNLSLQIQQHQWICKNNEDAAAENKISATFNTLNHGFMMVQGDLRSRGLFNNITLSSERRSLHQ